MILRVKIGDFPKDKNKGETSSQRLTLNPTITPPGGPPGLPPLRSYILS